MDKPSFKLVGLPCGHHGQYTFYKALRLTGPRERIVAIGDFFFVRIWQDSELVSIGELQLLWTDRVSDQTLVSLRLYFLPENTPDGRGLHGEDEVLAINDKVVLRAEDLLSWVCVGDSWRWGLRAVWKGSCAPPADPRHTAPLHHTKLDFSDVEREKSTIVDADFPGVVVFSYPRYCRYRALLSRLEGIQGDWLRDSLVAALGGYAAPTKNTRILYCKDTFEYPELEGHEFVCNHLAPRLKGRPRGRRRRPPRSRSHTPSSPSPSRSSDSEHERPPPQPRIQTPRRLTLRNGDKQSDDDDLKESSAEDRAFMNTLKQFYKDRNEPFNTSHTLKDLSLRALYAWVRARGGYEAVCGRKLWRLAAAQPARARAHYERFLLPFEHYERRNGHKLNGRVEEHPITTIEVIDSPLRDMEKKHNLPDKRLKTPSPKPEPVDSETGEVKEEYVTSKPAEELNREFLESLPKDERYLNVKPFEKLSDQRTDKKLQDVENKPITKSSSNVIDGVGCKQLNETVFVNEMQKPKSEASRTHHDVTLSSVSSLTSLSTLGDKYVNGHHDVPPVDQKNKPVGRSSLRAVRVKPARPNHAPANTPPTASLRADSASSSPQPAVNAAPPPVTNFGIHHPPAQISDDEIVEVPYKPKTPEIIDLDEYPESPQAIKKKKLDILKERGLEVTAIPTPAWPGPVPLTTINPLLNTAPMTLNPAVQHQIMTQVQLFQMYNIVPPNYANGIRPPKITQGTSIFGSSGPEKTVYGNPKDPFMPPPHILHGTPVKPQKNIASSTSQTPPQDILDLTCKNPSLTPQKPAVEIVRVPPTPSPSKASSAPQNLAKNYTLIDGKAVVGSNLEITLVNPKAQHNTMKNRTPQKRSSNGKFMSTKTVTPPKDFPKQYTCPSPSGVQKKSPIVVPNYQVNPRDDPSPTSSTGSRDSQTPQNYQNVVKNQNLAQFMEMQKSVPSFMDPMYMNAFYNSLGQMDQRQLAAYRDMMASQFRGYSGLLNMGAVTNTPTTKN
ncbi:AT-rich interactive domain-containing protein 5B-like [Achroia grisella]|uniref:AT-rich interactive domain-containing protein 5B-like n=1 Tax=Achroia grisella TaxID=688607 RepID=UPI0027D26B47|nr:AT-rich interactive domain-containing protein 5B-like [Achroia grisella]